MALPAIIAARPRALSAPIATAATAAMGTMRPTIEAKPPPAVTAAVPLCFIDALTPVSPRLALALGPPSFLSERPMRSTAVPAFFAGDDTLSSSLTVNSTDSPMVSLLTQRSHELAEDVSILCLDECACHGG